ncbi:ferric reductase-like transmembrane domain-containing protein [Natronosporangium hydrolyticum]|uniref:Ferric reductase-like transmembrane domain-containing protein n=2 Tax=Natronosporangium hydrolyticum TaxID=2811111 RepID=A0A895Y607_9ACTN|nr:ferric reductase-like transmembrane domain-containing protein [Natronosporangium hydrolyticum]
MQMSFSVRRTAWVVGYLLFILAPIFVMLTGTAEPARDFWTELSVAFGYAGLSMMGLQFGVTSRFRWVTEPWGEDVIYHFHRQISLIAVTLVLLHPAILFVTRPDLLSLLNVVDAPWRARFALLSVLALLVLVVTALWRVRLRLSYEVWHRLHIALAVTAVSAGVLHMIGWGFYLTDAWSRALWIGLIALWVAVLLYVRIVKPLFLIRRPYQVSEVRPERGETTTLVLDPVGHDGFRFQPGQFGWITVWRSPFTISAQPFSFSSSAEATGGRVEMSIRNLGDFTSSVPGIPVGKRVYLDGPYGAFTMGNPADMHVLVAGGIGITPMMSMLRTLADRGDRRPVMLLYGAKDWQSITFREELEELTGRLDLTTVYVLEDPPANWQGERGFINAEIFQRHLTPPYAEHEYFICGPEPMMDAVESALAELKVPKSKYHSERYSFL